MSNEITAASQQQDELSVVRNIQQHAFELGGTDGGDYLLDPSDLNKLISLASGLNLEARDEIHQRAFELGGTEGGEYYLEESDITELMLLSVELMRSKGSELGASH